MQWLMGTLAILPAAHLQRPPAFAQTTKTRLTSYHLEPLYLQPRVNAAVMFLDLFPNLNHDSCRNFMAWLFSLSSFFRAFDVVILLLPLLLLNAVALCHLDLIPSLGVCLGSVLFPILNVHKLFGHISDCQLFVHCFLVV